MLKEAKMAKAEKKAREAIKARRAREAKAGVKKPSHQVVGVLALPQPLLSPTTSYSVLPAIKKGTKVTKVETTEPPGPVTPEDGEIMISFPSVDDPLTPKSDVTSEAERDDASHPISPEEFSLTDYLKSHPQRKLIRKFLKQMNMTIGDLEEVIEWVVCVSNEVFLPAMTLHRTSSPESSDSSRWGSGVLQIISEKFHQRSSGLRKRLLGGQPPTPPSETNEELQGTADVFVSNILKRAKEDLFSSGEDDLETTNPGTTLTVERLSSIFSELFRDACESAQENARRIHHMRSGSRNNSRSRSLPGSSQGSSRSNMPELALNLCQLVECVDAETNPMLSLEHPSVSCSDSSGRHPLLEQGWMEEHIGSALLGQLSTIQADMGELENLTRPLPLANGDDSSSNRSSGSSTAASPPAIHLPAFSRDVGSERNGPRDSWSRSHLTGIPTSVRPGRGERSRFHSQRDIFPASLGVI
ncbi:hypothetical protein J4Q44_G00286020 [Coregonus suidteri]|uniref:Uncharacterized protein n=1 Tax=Coregonus suidteri TaxID=861788 RepID=A0AAN8KT14_9TELE